MQERPAPISYPCGLWIVCEWGSGSPAGQQLTFSLTGRILVCRIVPVKNRRYAANLAISTK